MIIMKAFIQTSLCCHGVIALLNASILLSPTNTLALMPWSNSIAQCFYIAVPTNTLALIPCSNILAQCFYIAAPNEYIGFDHGVTSWHNASILLSPTNTLAMMPWSNIMAQCFYIAVPTNTLALMPCSNSMAQCLYCCPQRIPWHDGVISWHNASILLYPTNTVPLMLWSYSMTQCFYIAVPNEYLGFDAMEQKHGTMLLYCCPTNTFQFIQGH